MQHANRLRHDRGYGPNGALPPAANAVGVQPNSLFR